MKRKPLKRHKSLQPYSREHHQGLLLCWKIRKGINNGTPLDRIKKYNDWFFEKYLKPHFNDEERFVFPILGEDHEMIKRAKCDHLRLIQLFSEVEVHEKTIILIEKELEQHIRFEERELFMLIQEKATPSEMEEMTELHNELYFEENITYKYWD